MADTLRVDSPDLHAEFAAMAPDAPLPWRTHKFKRWLIVDAKGEEVCNVDGSAEGYELIVAMILVAVNTCGGFKAELR